MCSMSRKKSSLERFSLTKRIQKGWTISYWKPRDWVKVHMNVFIFIWLRAAIVDGDNFTKFFETPFDNHMELL